MANKILKIGVMGVQRGFYPFRYANAFSDLMEVTALCEIDDDAIAARRDKESADLRNDVTLPDDITIYRDFDEFIHSGLDAVVLCNYFHEHAKYAIKALEAGVAVLSETTAAPSLGECVQLVEAVERTGVKYMLGANCIYFRAIQAMKQRMDEKKFGDPVFADCEYIHMPGAWNSSSSTAVEIDQNNLHWRQTLPRCYYNMHDFGPIMYVMNTYPKRVIGKAVVTDTPKRPLIDYDKCFALVEMENGAVINCSGCTAAGTTSKWYRIACTKGTLETVRYAEASDKLIEGELHTHQTVDVTWTNCGAITEEDEKRFGGDEALDLTSHAGIDQVLFLHFLRYLRDEEQPFFDVYNAVALSATSIMSWYSMLLDGKQLDIPDFRKKEDREKYRNDFRSPFGKRLADITLPLKTGEIFEI